MRQQTLADYQDTVSYWGTDICPECKTKCSSLFGVKQHYRAHDSSYNAEWLKYLYGVPTDWLLHTLHNVLRKSVNRMSDELSMTRRWIQLEMDRCNIPRRDRSEAEKLKWSQMSEEKRKQQVSAAHKRTRELAEKGEHSFHDWWRENPEKAHEQAKRAAALGSEHREVNGMEGVTGQDHHAWRGGKCIRDAVVKQMSWDISWDKYKRQIQERADRTCYACDEQLEQSSGILDTHHVIPVVCGGLNEDWNMMVLCRTCHSTAERYIRQYPEFDPVLVE